MCHADDAADNCFKHSALFSHALDLFILFLSRTLNPDFVREFFEFV